MAKERHRHVFFYTLLLRSPRPLTTHHLQTSTEGDDKNPLAPKPPGFVFNKQPSNQTELLHILYLAVQGKKRKKKKKKKNEKLRKGNANFKSSSALRLPSLPLTGVSVVVPPLCREIEAGKKGVIRGEWSD